MAFFNMSSIKTVLFDEERDSSEVTKQLLHQTGVRNSRHIRDIEEAVDICFRMEVNVLIVDMDSKNSSGQQLIRRLRKIASKQSFETRILALIGTKEQETVLEAASCGVDSIIMKPVAADAMKKRLIKVYEMEVSYHEFEDYLGPDRRIMPDRLPSGETTKRSDD